MSNKSIPLSDETYWKLRSLKDTWAKNENKRITYDKVIQHLLTVCGE